MQELTSTSAAPITPTTPAPSPIVPTVCPTCHVEVRSTDYFCYNCGHNLKPKPLSTSIVKQFTLYAGSLLLPPLGLVWGWPYLKEATIKAKMIGVVTILLTVVSLVTSVYYAVQFANSINQQVNDEMSRLQGFN